MKPISSIIKTITREKESIQMLPRRPRVCTPTAMADLSYLVVVEHFDGFLGVGGLAVDDKGVSPVEVVAFHHESHLVDGAGLLEDWDQLVFQAVPRYLANENFAASRGGPGPVRRGAVAPLPVLLVYVVARPRHELDQRPRWGARRAGAVLLLLFPA